MEGVRPVDPVDQTHLDVRGLARSGYYRDDGLPLSPGVVPEQLRQPGRPARKVGEEVLWTEQGDVDPGERRCELD